MHVCIFCLIVEIAVKRSPIPGNHAPVRILLRGEPDSVTVASQTHLYTYDFQQPQKVVNSCAATGGCKASLNVLNLYFTVTWSTVIAPLYFSSQAPVGMGLAWCPDSITPEVSSGTWHSRAVVLLDIPEIYKSSCPCPSGLRLQHHSGPRASGGWPGVSVWNRRQRDAVLWRGETAGMWMWYWERWRGSSVLLHVISRFFFLLQRGLPWTLEGRH